ncbi:protein of unknown function [Bradyrhizobium sp. ORS 285]|uniref:PAS domain-containing protein n=1 Tax=Bradyrhizobium sp. ORS 285 TaxID=115808 RepID=UPI00024089AF|nr:PAS domain-containing protein [Bradyrhizobium sp. ORS 285]CCD86270.1 hypothetical protein BRAO285_1800022 [Bradyrhizobium sp. ORS 285]SMX61233.1 protein of unknown function [Bradyrhizobium sp. ORS 285]
MSAGDVPSDTARHHPDHELLSAELREIETIYASARVGLCVLDRDLRYRRVNGRLAEMNGIPAMGHIGKTVREIVPTLADEVERIASRIFETGEPVIDLEISAQGERWDEAAINEYGDFATFRSIVETETYRRDVAPHRHAALDDFRLLALSKTM